MYYFIETARTSCVVQTSIAVVGVEQTARNTEVLVGSKTIRVRLQKPLKGRGTKA